MLWWMLAPVAVALALSRGVGWLLPRGWRPFWRRVAWPSAAWLAVAGAGVVLNALQAPLTWRRLDTNVGFVLAVAVAADWVYQGALSGLRAYFGRLERTAEDGPEVRRTVEPMGRWAAGLAIAAIAASVVFAHFGVNLSAFLATAGVASVAVALAAQATLSNLLAGILLLLERPLREGDWVTVGQDMGRVVAIGLRSTQLRTPGGTRVVVPNAVVVGGRVENHTAAGMALVRVSVGVAATAGPAEEVRGKLWQRASAVDGLSPIPPPWVRFVGCDGTRNTWEVAGWAQVGRDPTMVREALALAVLAAVEEAGWGTAVVS